MIAQGGPGNPIQLDPWETIVAVGWNGAGIGVLTIDYPVGVSLSFEPPFDAVVTLPQLTTVTKANLSGDINLITFDTTPNLGALYEPTTDFLWIIDSMLFPDTILPDGTTYDEYKALYSIQPPAVMYPQRWQEIVDLRSLQNTGVIAASYMNYPHDQSQWATWDYGVYNLDGGGTSPGYLPPPGEPFYGLGEHQTSTTEAGRTLTRSIWLIDFASNRVGGALVYVDDPSPSTDPKITGGYNMPVSLKIYPADTTFTVTDFAVAGDKPATIEGTLSVPYDKGGTLFSLNSGGLFA